ncbi:HGL105Wp [Eremothecium sinecaudum]|uniref:HGL105Wp n=1 Tax=Eremothecium sinecaudum TaxID=45286 RepID=A0A0X8HVM6_9SACH|nr:HGL105Wp [Eremothecium sinecaudum]AMD22235.1 HGL105Wp [Eremothecium sinecaudum]
MDDHTDHIIHYERLRNIAGVKFPVERDLVVPYFHPRLLPLSQYYNKTINVFIKDIESCLAISIKLYKYYNHQSNCGPYLTLWFLNNPVNKVKIVGCVIGSSSRRKDGEEILLLRIDDCTGTIWCQMVNDGSICALREGLYGFTVAVTGYLELANTITVTGASYTIMADKITVVPSLRDEVQFWEITTLCREELHRLWELDIIVVNRFYTSTNQYESSSLSECSEVDLISDAVSEWQISSPYRCDSGYSERISSADSRAETENDPGFKYQQLKTYSQPNIQVRYTLNQYKIYLIEWFLENIDVPQIPYYEPYENAMVLSQILEAIATVRFYNSSGKTKTIKEIKMELYDTSIVYFESMGIIGIAGEQKHLIVKLKKLKEFITSRIGTWTKLQLASGKVFYKHVRDRSGLGNLTKKFILMLVKAILRHYLSKSNVKISDWFMETPAPEYILLRLNYNSTEI